MLSYEVLCEHVSGVLKTRNLFGWFDDTNGIDTCENLIRKALSGTGWKLAYCDTFYEADGITEKIRSYAAEEKTGAWMMIQGICDLFFAYPEFDGDKREVRIRSRKDHDGLMEITFGKNTEQIRRRLDSSALVTRLYVQGDYTDNGYVGIEDAKKNESGLGYIFNFDYYRETGVFTQAHEDALAAFIESSGVSSRQISEKTQQKLALEREFGDVVSTYGAVYYKVVGSELAEPWVINKVRASQIPLAGDDEVCFVKMNGNTCTEYEYGKYAGPEVLDVGVTHVVKFITTINGLLMTSENFVNTMSGTAQMAEQVEEYKRKTLEYMGRGVVLAEQIDALTDEITLMQNGAAVVENTFTELIGDMLKEGYWTDSQYIVGQEDSLYADALEISAKMAYPQCEWTVDVRDTGKKEEEFFVNQLLRIYDEVTGLKQYAFVDKIMEYPRRYWDNSVTISTDDLGLTGKSLTNILSRVTDMAEMLRLKASIYDRSEAIGSDGTITMQLLEGMIDISKNKIMASGSNWYTDEAGNMIFVSLDGGSAMMLAGAGFMIANGKNDDGSWNWRSFGTGDGFTADMIVTGFMSADRIQVGTIGSQHLSIEAVEAIDLRVEEGANKVVDIRMTEDSIMSTVSSSKKYQEDIGNLQDQIDNMDVEVGGRNLIANSDRTWTLMSGSDAVEEELVLVDTVVPDNLRGKQYTLSFRMDTADMTAANIASGIQFGMEAVATWENEEGTTLTIMYPMTEPKAIDNERVSFTEVLDPPVGYTVLSDLRFFVLAEVPDDMADTQLWEISHPKFEYGTTDTDWTPATEDLQQQVMDATNQLDNKITADLQENYATKTEVVEQRQTIIQQTDDKISIQVERIDSSIKSANDR